MTTPPRRLVQHLVAILDQPPVHLTGQREILASVTDEHPGHSTPPHHRRSHPPRRLGVCGVNADNLVARRAFKESAEGMPDTSGPCDSEGPGSRPAERHRLTQAG
jgi:hypothetical protein